MYDDHRASAWLTTPDDEAWFDEPPSGGLDRLTHLVLVDGRLVEVWSEPVTGTRWQHHADRFDRERRPPSPPPPRSSAPVRPEHELVLTWLDAVVGGRERLLALDAGPPVGEEF